MNTPGTAPSFQGSNSISNVYRGNNRKFVP